MLAKIYDALTITLILAGIVAIVLVIIYREELFGKAKIGNKPEDSHEYLDSSNIKVESRWLEGIGNLRDAEVFLPTGLEAIVFASGLNNPQEILVLEEENIVLVTEQNTGNIVVLKDSDLDYSADSRSIFKSSLPNPKGIDYENNNLFVGTSEGVLKYENFPEQLSKETSNYIKVVSSLPRVPGGLSISVGLGGLFVSVPSTCNYCVETDIRRGSIVEYSLDGSEEKIYATGLRSVSGLGFIQGTLVAAEHSIESDIFSVRDEINLIRKDGFYGWPYYVNANEVFTPFSTTPPAGIKPIIPSILFEPNSKPSGFTYIETNPFSENNLYVALAEAGKVVQVNYTSLESDVRDFMVVKLAGEILSNPVDVKTYENGLLILDRNNGVLFFVRPQTT